MYEISVILSNAIYETWQVDAFGIRDFGSTMPVCKQPVAAFALYAFVALVELYSKSITLLCH